MEAIRSGLRVVPGPAHSGVSFSSCLRGFALSNPPCPRATSPSPQPLHFSIWPYLHATGILIFCFLLSCYQALSWVIIITHGHRFKTWSTDWSPLGDERWRANKSLYCDVEVGFWSKLSHEAILQSMCGHVLSPVRDPKET